MQVLTTKASSTDTDLTRFLHLLDQFTTLTQRHEAGKEPDWFVVSSKSNTKGSRLLIIRSYKHNAEFFYARTNSGVQSIKFCRQIYTEDR